MPDEITNDQVVDKTLSFYENATSGLVEKQKGSDGYAHVAGAGYTSQSSITRPADTTAYTAGEEWIDK